MEEPFILTVPYQSGEKDIEAQLQTFGYSYRFCVNVNEGQVFFERDDEGHFRALLPPDAAEKWATSLDVKLLEAIAKQLEKVLS